MGLRFATSGAHTYSKSSLVPPLILCKQATPLFNRLYPPFALDLPVSTFSTAEELGDLVIRDWLGVLDSLYPPLNKRLIEPDCWEMLEHHLEQESFQEFSRRNIVLTRTFQNVLLALHRYVEGIRTKDDSENKSSLYIPGIVSYQSPENMVASSEEDVLGKSIFLLSGKEI